MRTVRGIPLAATLLFLAPVVFGEAGSPYVVTPFDKEDVVPTNALVPLPGDNGVPISLTRLKRLQPRLVSESGSIPLRIVDSFDDLEGHATPFPTDGGGYGRNLILLSPRWRLKPNTRYAFTVGADTQATTHFMLATGAEPDTKPPKWGRPPFLDPTPPKADVPLMPSTIVTALTEPPDLPLFVVVELTPQEPTARPKRMIAALQLAGTADPNCDFVTVWDHAHGVFGEDTDRELGRRYLAKLTAIDAAGNRRRAPGSGVPIVWSGNLAICNRPAALPPVTPTPPQPRWLGPPRHQAEFDDDFKGTGPSRNAQYKHVLHLPLQTTTFAFVELTIRRLAPPGTGYRRIAISRPTLEPSTTDANTGGSNPDCIEPLITNLDRGKPMPADDERIGLRVAVIDSFGRRLPHPGPPLTVSNLHPGLSQISVCPETTPPQQSPAH